MSNQPTPWWLTILGILAFVGFWVGVFPRHRESADWRRSDPEGKENTWIATSQTPHNDTEEEFEMRKRSYILFFALIAIIGIFLGKQVDPPFGNSYYWLYENLPGFNAFREASKFYVLIALGYSVGLASLINWLLPPSRHPKERMK